MASKGSHVKDPAIRSFSLPNGEKIVSLRESTFRAAVKAAGNTLRAERSKNSGTRKIVGPKLKAG